MSIKSTICGCVPDPGNTALNVPVHSRGWHRCSDTGWKRNRPLRGFWVSSKATSTWVKYLFAQQSNWTLYPTNRDQKEVRNNLNILVHGIPALLTLVASLLLFSPFLRGLSTCLAQNDLICYLRIPENLHIQHSTYRKGEIWSHL